MCKEMPVIPVNRVVDKKRIIGKRRAKGGERHKGLQKRLPPYTLAGFDLTTHDSTGRDDTTTRPRHQGA
jgi:hypothetical protein